MELQGSNSSDPKAALEPPPDQCNQCAPPQNQMAHLILWGKIALGGGGVTRKPIFPTPRPPSLAAVTGGGVQGRGARPAVPGGGGGSTQHLWLKMIPTSR